MHNHHQFKSLIESNASFHMDTQAQSKLIQCNEIEKEVRPQKVSKFRRFLPQVREFSQ